MLKPKTCFRIFTFQVCKEIYSDIHLSPKLHSLHTLILSLVMHCGLWAYMLFCPLSHLFIKKNPLAVLLPVSCQRSRTEC